MGDNGDLYLVPGCRHGAPVFGPQFVQRVLSHVSAFLRFLKLMLDLAVFGQVDGCDLLLLLNINKKM